MERTKFARVLLLGLAAICLALAVVRFFSDKAYVTWLIASGLLSLLSWILGPACYFVGFLCSSLWHWIATKSISSIIYTGLWGLALFGAALSYLTLQENKLLGFQGGFGHFVFAIFGLTTLALQGAVYLDLHKIEDKLSDAKKEYPDYIERTHERFIRFLLMVSLLFGVGKIADVVSPFLKYDKVPLLNVEVGLKATREAIGHLLHPDHSSQVLFVFGSIAVFFLLFIWNAFACYHSFKARGPSRDADELAATGIIFAKIGLFAFLSAVCFLYWLLILIGTDPTTFSLAFSIVFSVCVIVAVPLRWDWVRQPVHQWLVRLLRKIGTIVTPPTG
jgi:hypothetical protein